MNFRLALRQLNVPQAFVGLALFWLPWQTRWIYAQRTIGGEPFEYGQLSVYVVEGLVLLAAIALGRPRRAAALAKSAGGSFVFLGACFIAASFAWDGATATAQLLHLAAVAALFLVLLDERVTVVGVTWAFSLGLIAPCLLGWWQTLMGGNLASTIFGLGAHQAAILGQAVVELADGERLLRAYGSFTHPNVFGGYLVIALLALTALKPLRRWQRIAVTGLTVLLGATLVITFSRSAWLGLLIGLLIGQWPAICTKRLTDGSARRFLVVLAATVLSAGAIFSQALFVRLEGQTRLEEKSVTERVQEYQTWAEVWRRNPFAGVGPGGYPLARAQVDPGQPVYSYQPIHNSFLLALAEVGLIGLVGLCWWLTQTGKMFWSAVRRKDLWPAALAATLLPPLLLDHYLWSNWSGLAMLAVVLALGARRAAEA